jgi:tetratricopeptide (TPR) repeat protein
MKIGITILTLMLLSSSLTFASDRSFSKAQEAYDDGRYAEAVMLYDGLVSSGIKNKELYYNLANACFKDGDLPRAVLHYRQAWYQAPRDPDIQANMHFALNAAGAIEPAPGLIDRLFETLSQSEWITAAIGAYLVFTILLFLAMIIPPAKRSLIRMSLLPAVVVLAAAFGWWEWQQLGSRPEWVVWKSGGTALFGPVEGSTAHYKVPLGALVRQKSADSKGWVEIEYDGKAGWLKREYIKPVSP